MNRAGRIPLAGSVTRFATALCLLLALCTAALIVSPWEGAVAVTDSMRPAVPKWSFILAKPVPSDRISPGDIIIFRDPAQGVSVMHRVVRVDPVQGQVWTKGDANPEADAYGVPFELIELRYIVHAPRIGWLVYYGKQYSLLIALGLVSAYAALLTGGLLRRRDSPWEA